MSSTLSRGLAALGRSRLRVLEVGAPDATTEDRAVVATLGAVRWTSHTGAVPARLPLTNGFTSGEDHRTNKESDMKPEIKSDSLSTSYYGQDIYVEARQPVGGKAFVSLVQAGELPDIEGPDCGDHDTLEQALRAGLRLATTLIDN